MKFMLHWRSKMSTCTMVRQWDVLCMNGRELRDYYRMTSMDIPIFCSIWTITTVKFYKTRQNNLIDFVIYSSTFLLFVFLSHIFCSKKKFISRTFPHFVPPFLWTIHVPINHLNLPVPCDWTLCLVVTKLFLFKGFSGGLQFYSLCVINPMVYQTIKMSCPKIQNIFDNKSLYIKHYFHSWMMYVFNGSQIRAVYRRSVARFFFYFLVIYGEEKRYIFLFDIVNICCYWMIQLSIPRTLCFISLLQTDIYIVTMYYFRVTFHAVTQYPIATYTASRSHWYRIYQGETLLLIRNFWFSIYNFEICCCC